MLSDGFEMMRDENNFGTVIINAEINRHPGVKMYRGLPLNYVAMEDARAIAEKALKSRPAKFKRFIYLGPFESYAEFAVKKKKVWINLDNRDKLDPNSLSLTKMNNKEKEYLAGLPQDGNNETLQNQKLLKTMEPPAPYQAIISGVPDYQTIYSKGCAPAAAGCVLGYHDGNYPRLIVKGSKYTEGQEDPDGYGYLHTIWNELGPAMGYVRGVGTYRKIAVGIKTVCNGMENNYNFDAKTFGFASPQSHFNTVKTEVNAKRPMDYVLRYPTYGGGIGQHAVTLIGYGKLKAPWIPDSRLSNKLQKPAESFEYNIRR